MAERQGTDRLSEDVESAVTELLPAPVSPLVKLLRHPLLCSVLSGLSVTGLFWLAGALPWSSPVARADAVDAKVGQLRGEVQGLSDQVRALAADNNEVYVSSLGTRIQSLQQWACKLRDPSLKEEAERLQRLYIVRTKTRYPDTRCPTQEPTT